jgi:hypothetical protein
MILPVTIPCRVRMHRNFENRAKWAVWEGSGATFLPPDKSLSDKPYFIEFRGVLAPEKVISEGRAR